MKKPNLISILVLNRNRSKQTIEIFNQLKKQSFQGYNYIVVDDNSENLDLLNKVASDRFIVISYPPPFKFGLVKKYNFGFKKIIDNGSKYVYIMQNDMELNSVNLLEELVLYAEKNTECAVVGPTVINGKGIVCWGEGIKKIRMGHEFNVSESFMIRTDWLVKYGLWNSKMIYYGEEMDFFCRVKNSGYTTDVIENVALTHFGGGTSSSFQNEKDYYRPKSSIFVMKLHNKNDSLKVKVRYLFDELWEPRTKIYNYWKQRRIINVIKTTALILIGIISGLCFSAEDK